MSNVFALNGLVHLGSARNALLESMRARLDDWRVYRRTRSELMELSSRELDELGIGRSDIGSVAYDAVRARR